MEDLSKMLKGHRKGQMTNNLVINIDFKMMNSWAFQWYTSCPYSKGIGFGGQWRSFWRSQSAGSTSNPVELIELVILESSASIWYAWSLCLNNFHFEFSQMTSKKLHHACRGQTRSLTPKLKSKSEINSESIQKNDCERGNCAKFYGHFHKKLWCLKCSEMAAEKAKRLKMKTKMRKSENAKQKGSTVISLYFNFPILYFPYTLISLHFNFPTLISLDYDFPIHRWLSYRIRSNVYFGNQMAPPIMPHL